MSSQHPQRVELAREYFQSSDHLADQERWYDRKATRYKKWHCWLGIIIIAAGAGTTVIQLWAPSPPDQPVGWVAIMTALLGATVILAKGAERVWGFDDTWLSYRQAAEAMKRERRLFVNGSGAYRECPEDRQAYLLFVERIEEIIAEEQRAYWDRRNKPKDAESSEAKAGEES